MKTDGIDLMAQLKTMINEEDLLAFFDFSFNTAGNHPITGLCKVSAQGRHGMGLDGLSILFILDLPDRSAQREVDDFFNDLPWDRLADRVPCLKVAVPMPAIILGPTAMIKQVDLSLHLEYYTEVYLTEKLVPHLAALTKIDAGEVVLWNKAEAPPTYMAEVDIPPSEGSSLVKWFKGLFGTRG